MNVDDGFASCRPHPTDRPERRADVASLRAGNFDPAKEVSAGQQLQGAVPNLETQHDASVYPDLSGSSPLPMQPPTIAPRIAPGPKTTAHAKAPSPAPRTAFSVFALSRRSGFIGARVLPFQPLAVRVVMLLFSRLQVMCAA